MEKIDKGYAVIYIDKTGDTLSEISFSPNNLVSDYYNTPGNIQWNYYLIISEESLKFSNITKKEIEENEYYTRKFVLPLNKIDDFIKERFPDVKEKVGEIILVKGDDWDDAQIKANAKFDNSFSSVIRSYYRNNSLMDTIVLLDLLRAKLITNPEKKYIFFTHISNEYSLAEKKLKMFVRK
ncbi:MAG: ABC-three component system middle component 1 [Bacteroidia bacterium]